MKNKRSLWVSLISVVAIAAIALGATVAAGWSPKLGLDLDGGLSVVYKTHRSVTKAQLATIVTILGDRVNAGTTGASVDSQGGNQISVSIPGEKNSAEGAGRPREHGPALLPTRRVLRTGLHRGQGQDPHHRPAGRVRRRHATDRRQSAGHPRLEQRERLHQQHQHPARPPVRHLPIDPPAPGQQGRHGPPARVGHQRLLPAVRPRAGRDDRDRREVGLRPAQQRSVGGQPQPHQ